MEEETGGGLLLASSLLWRGGVLLWKLEETWEEEEERRETILSYMAGCNSNQRRRESCECLGGREELSLYMGGGGGAYASFLCMKEAEWRNNYVECDIYYMPYQHVFIRRRHMYMEGEEEITLCLSNNSN